MAKPRTPACPAPSLYLNHGVPSIQRHFPTPLTCTSPPQPGELEGPQHPHVEITRSWGVGRPSEVTRTLPSWRDRAPKTTDSWWGEEGRAPRPAPAPHSTRFSGNASQGPMFPPGHTSRGASPCSPEGQHGQPHLGFRLRLLAARGTLVRGPVGSKDPAVTRRPAQEHKGRLDPEGLCGAAGPSSALRGSLSRGSGKCLGPQLQLCRHTRQPAHPGRCRCRSVCPRQAQGHLVSQMAQLTLWGRVRLDHSDGNAVGGGGLGVASGGPGSPAHLGEGLSWHKQASLGHRAWRREPGGTAGPKQPPSICESGGNISVSRRHLDGRGAGRPWKRQPLRPGPGAAGTAGRASPLTPTQRLWQPVLARGSAC